jgi:AraC-like DNA-binding protein
MTTPSPFGPTDHYLEMPPPAALASRLACLWVRRAGAASRGPVVPDGCTDLMWMGDGAQARLVVAGPDTRPYPARLRPDTSIAAVRFLPGAARTVLGVPLDAIRDERPELADLWGADAADRLADEVAETDRPERVLAAAVAGRLRAAGPEPRDEAAMRHVAAALGSTAEPSPVRALAESAGLSERQLHRRSLAAFGYGPKMLHRVLRFQRALERARAGDDLARVAHDCGYTDQAHLARDVAALTGSTITGLLAA